VFGLTINRRWVTNAKNAFAPDARNNEDLGVELFAISPKFKSPPLPLITENWDLDLKPGAVSPCLYDWKNYQYCAQIKTVIRSSATDKVLHPTLSFTVNANCSAEGKLSSGRTMTLRCAALPTSPRMLLQSQVSNAIPTPRSKLLAWQ
jgi:hypothetical protein